MKKTKTGKRVFSLILAGMMAMVGITGCGGSQESDEYVIGATGPLTGDSSSYGTSVKNGAQLAITEINEAGGLNGNLFRFEMKDDKGTSEDAISGYSALRDEGMQISIGSVTSGSCEAFASEAANDNLFLITPSASAQAVIDSGDHAFRVCFGDPDQGTIAAQKLTETYSNIGVIYDTSDVYSSGVYEAFEEEMNNLGASYSVQSFDAENKKDFSTQVESLVDCDVIFLPIYYVEAGLIAKACVSKGCNAVLFGTDGLDGVADQVDDTVTNTIQYITPFDVNSTDAKVVDFVEKYEETYNETPDQFAADGYDAIYVIYEGMKAAGVDDVNIDASELCDLMIETITGSSFSYEGVTGSMTWDTSGACTKDPQIVEL